MLEEMVIYTEGRSYPVTHSECAPDIRALDTVNADRVKDMERVCSLGKFMSSSLHIRMDLQCSQRLLASPHKQLRIQKQNRISCMFVNRVQHPQKLIPESLCQSGQ